MSVVVLTRNFAYWGERPINDVIRLIVKGKAEIVRAEKGREIRGGITRDGIVFKMPAPLVVRLVEFVGYHIKSEKIQFSKEAVWERDHNVCQYYHRDEKGRRFRYKCNSEDRSIDHIIPKIQGGKNSFINCVTACKECNGKTKGGRTPREAGMELISIPVVPKRRKGDMVVLSFAFNPHSKAHQALADMGIKFSY